MFTPSRKPQGWCSDPYGRHEARWFSGGSPSALVRDSGVESTDPPKGHRSAGEPEPVTGPEEELVDRPAGSENDTSVDAVWSIFVSAGAD